MDFELFVEGENVDKLLEVTGLVQEKGTDRLILPKEKLLELKEDKDAIRGFVAGIFASSRTKIVLPDIIEYTDTPSRKFTMEVMKEVLLDCQVDSIIFRKNNSYILKVKFDEFFTATKLKKNFTFFDNKLDTIEKMIELEE